MFEKLAHEVENWQAVRHIGTLYGTLTRLLARCL